MLGERVDERKRHALADQRLFALHNGERDRRRLFFVSADIDVHAQARPIDQSVAPVVHHVLGVLVILGQTEVVPVDGFKRLAQIEQRLRAAGQVLLARVQPGEIIAQHYVEHLRTEIILGVARFGDHHFRRLLEPLVV